ncbi:MAG: uridine-cytidine kinase [Candidatus Krumholzibacteria bacterium]|jgi:uridine kinase|nr:uridine-cytidine kinase [Candidatus Krumholzibacteria bacterium]
MTGKDKIPVIGIAGGSCSGKSSIAAALASMLRDRGGAAILSLDSYYIDLAHLPPEERGRRNFDAPEAIDIALAEAHLRALAAGESVLTPVYRFEDHTRTPESEWIRIGAGSGRTAGAMRNAAPNGIVILEGLFALYFHSIRSILDLSVFVDATHERCLSRRLRRDVAERGRAAAGVAEQYEKTVKPMFELHVAPTREYADMTVDGEAGAAQAAAAILARLAEMGLP